MLPQKNVSFSEAISKVQSLEKAGQLDQARGLCQKLVHAAPKRVEPHFQLARIERSAGNVAAAIDHLRDAKALKPREPAILLALIDMLSAHGEDDEALKICDSLIRIAPRDMRFLIDKALILQRIGEFEQAEASLRKAQALNPLRGEPYRMLTANRKVKPDDPLIGKMQTALARKNLPAASRIEIEFAMAKAMEDTGQYGDVFRYLTPANAAMKSTFGYEISDRRDEVTGLIDAFRGFDFTPDETADESFAPIFVTGLPRSGTTLVEQILASHSQVTSGGEMPHALRLAYGVIGNPGRGFTPMPKLARSKISQLAEQYQASVRASVSFERIVTDKAIQSHLVMGLLKLAIPSARFIVVRRDPRDLLFSIYKNLFAQGTHRYAYDLEDLAKYYATFLQMLDFWRENLPGGFHEVHYEDLVADPEAQSRALIAAAGLEWEDACLEFHKSRGPVKTLSVQQVRQPIYKSSAQAWRRYETELQPLVDALEKEGVL